MRFVVFSDIHLNLWNYGATIEHGWNSRLLHQASVLNQIVDYCNEHDIKTVFFLGDLFHTHQIVQVECLMVAQGAFTNLCRNRQVLCLPGNHDYSDKEGKKHSLVFLNNQCKVIEGPTTLTMEDVPRMIHALPYTENEEDLRSFLGNTDPGSIVLLHQGISNVPVNSSGFARNELLSLDMIPDHVAATFAGHYHSFTAPRGNVIIPGSPLQLTWSDRGQIRGWLDCEITDEGCLSVRPIRSKAPVFIEVEFDEIEEDAELVMGNFVRVLNAPENSNVNLVRDLLLARGVLSVEILTAEQTGGRCVVGNPQLMSFEEIFKEYCKANNVTMIQKNMARQIMEGKYTAPEDD